MDSLLNRYRGIILLLVVLVAQLIFLAYQVKTDNDVRVIRVWAVTLVTPIAQIAENTRGAIYGVFHNYFDLHNARAENRQMRSDLDKLKLENQFLKAELNTADRVKALAAFEKQTPSRLVAARIIGTATTSVSKIVFLDRGSNAEVEKGMAVITPDGIVGKVLDAYPTASQALLATDPGFAAGVVSQKNHVRGILRGVGSGKCKVDMVQNEEKVDVGEMFYTSGDDRIFPRGLPVGKAAVVREGTPFKDILVYPIGLQNGPEEVLIVLQGKHQIIPEHVDSTTEPVYLGNPPPSGKSATEAAQPLTTDADHLVERYKAIGALEGHKFGEGNAPNFNVPVPTNASSLDKPSDTPAKPPVNKPAIPKLAGTNSPLTNPANTSTPRPTATVTNPASATGIAAPPKPAVKPVPKPKPPSSEITVKKPTPLPPQSRPETPDTEPVSPQQ
jgi:rod shape-determining protein MreC